MQGLYFPMYIYSIMLPSHFYFFFYRSECLYPYTLNTPTGFDIICLTLLTFSRSREKHVEYARTVKMRPFMFGIYALIGQKMM